MLTSLGKYRIDRMAGRKLLKVGTMTMKRRKAHILIVVVIAMAPPAHLTMRNQHYHKRGYR